MTEMEQQEHFCPHCPHCNPTLPAAEVKRVRMMQAEQPHIYQWNAVQLERLEKALNQGDKVVVLYAFSVVIKRADGTLEEHKRGEAK
jgi:predicted alpha/beta hydrolase family esterase